MFDNYTSDISQVKQVTSFFHNIIQQEVEQGISSTNIMLAGFSQGGALALYTSLTSPVQLGATLVLSSYLLAAWEFTSPLPNSDCPILICHGSSDNMVRLIVNIIQ